MGHNIGIQILNLLRCFNMAFVEFYFTFSSKNNITSDNTLFVFQTARQDFVNIGLYIPNLAEILWLLKELYLLLSLMQ